MVCRWSGGGGGGGRVKVIQDNTCHLFLSTELIM